MSTPKTEQTVSAIQVVISGGNELVCEPLRRLKALFLYEAWPRTQIYLKALIVYACEFRREARGDKSQKLN